MEDVSNDNVGEGLVVDSLCSRKFLSNRLKLDICEKVVKAGFREEKFSLRALARQYNVQPAQIRRQVISTWCVDALKDLPVELLKNAWRHAEMSYFPAEAQHSIDTNEDDMMVELEDDMMDELDLDEHEHAET